jgi:Protein of unknown function (DUF2699).
MMNEFSLQGSEERFRYCVVIAGASAAHALDPANPLYTTTEIACCNTAILDQSEKQPLARAPPYHGVVERCDHEVVCHPPLHAPPNYAAGEDIQNDCQIQPALGCPDIGDISCPKTIRHRGREVPSDQVGRNRALVVRIRRHLETAHGLYAKTVLLHQAPNAILAYEDALLAKFPANAVGTICSIAADKGRLD